MQWENGQSNGQETHEIPLRNILPDQESSNSLLSICFYGLRDPLWDRAYLYADGPMTNQNSSHTIGYLRVSTDTQDLDKNRADILTLANKENLGRVRFVEEKVSGKVPWRKRKIAAVLDELSEGDALIVSELSRLGRSMLECMEILSIAAAAHIRVYAIKGDWRLDETIQSKIIAIAFSMAAEIEHDLISATTTEALRARKAAGLPLGRRFCRKLFRSRQNLGNYSVGYRFEAILCPRLGRQRSKNRKISLLLPIDMITFRIIFCAKKVCDRTSRGWVLAFCLAEGVKPWHDALTAAGARWHGAMVWIKPDATPQFAGCGPARGFECIAVAWAGPGRRHWNGGGRRGVLTCPTAKGGYVAAKPVALMRGLVDLFTQSGDHICDPFMGSGSTGVAALETGRRFTGIDCEGEAVRLAKARLASAACRPALPLSGPRPVQAGLDLGEGWS